MIGPMVGMLSRRRARLAPPAYLGGLEYAVVLTQGQPVSASLLGAFSNASGIVLAAGAHPAGMGLAAGVWSGAPTAVQGRHWMDWEVMGPGGALPFRTLVSVKPDMPAGAFGAAYTATSENITHVGNLTGLSNRLIRNVIFPSGTTIENCSNLGLENCFFAGQVTVRSSSQIAIVGSLIEHEGEDGFRISNTGSGSHNILFQLNEVRGANKDAINVAGDQAFNTGIRLLDNWLHGTGDSAGLGPGFEHGLYAHSEVEFRGNVVEDMLFGNCTSFRSGFVCAVNFFRNCLEAGVSVYHDHRKSDPPRALIEGNVFIEGLTEGGVKLRTPKEGYEGDVLDTYTIRDNIFATGVADVTINAGYGAATILGGAGVGELGNRRVSLAAATAMVPPLVPKVMPV